MKVLVVTAAAILFSTFAHAQTTTQKHSSAEVAGTSRTIVVSLEDRKMALVENGVVTRTYTVAVGKPSTPSPEGIFTIARRVANPTYQHNGKTIPAGPANPVGTRWMGLSKTGYGIHGTNEPNSIGTAASHGCIRMGQVDLEEFYKLVSVGDTVQIIAHRNQEIAALFTPTPAVTEPTPVGIQAALEPATPATAEPNANAAAPATAGSL